MLKIQLMKKPLKDTFLVKKKTPKKPQLKFLRKETTHSIF